MANKVWETEKSFLSAISSMEQIGVLVDIEKCKEQISIGLRRMKEETNNLGMEPKSHVELKKLLVDRMGLPVVKKTPGGVASFNKEAMLLYEELLEGKQDTTAKSILSYRGWKQTIGLYYRPFLTKMSSPGRLHPNYKLHGTVTGRLSCTDPNLQQMPKHSIREWNANTKKVIVPDPGWELWEFDYKQLELRLAAMYSGEESLIETLNNPELDVFDSMAESLNWERNDVKTNTYLTLFGGGDERRAAAFNIPLHEARKLGKEFFTTYPKLKEAAIAYNGGWVDGYREEGVAKRDGYVIYWSGRRRHFPNGFDSHKAFNSLLQGGGAEVTKTAIVRLQNEVCDNNCQMIMTIHDSIVFRIREGMFEMYVDRILEAMERAPTDEFTVKMYADYKIWGT